jgi:hypothetical protein
MLTPSYAAQELIPAVADAQTHYGKQAPGRPHLSFKEKRLDVKKWLYRGENYKGSHFPLCVFTNNVGRKSEERFIARAKKRATKSKKDNTAVDQGAAEPQSRWRSQHWWSGENVPQSRWGGEPPSSSSNALIQHGGGTNIVAQTPDTRWNQQWWQTGYTGWRDYSDRSGGK